MNALKKIKCSNCGKTFKPGNTNGLPNGITLVMKNNDKITLCQSCLCKIGSMTEAEKNDYFKNSRSLTTENGTY